MVDNVAITAGAGTTIAADDVGGILHQRVKLSLGADGSATDALGGAGAVASGVQRVTLASDDPAVALLTTTNTRLTNALIGEYETVTASQRDQALGATGGAGDYIARVVIVPATTSPGEVLLLDNATSITVFVGGASSVSDLKPFSVDLGMTSVSGAWKITTGADVSVVAVGNFSA